MQKMPYHLHSICVHDGNANSGHYYTLIYDRFQKKWRKFNDIRVTEYSEEDVFKEAEGGHSWMTAYWLVYVQESIAKELETTNINQYKVPENPYVLGDFTGHCYGKKVPGDVNLVVQTENSALAKEIDDQKNQRIISDIKDMYNKMYGCYKEEFSPKDQGAHSSLKCLAAYLWDKNEKDILKKFVLAEAYKSSLPDHPEFSDLKPDSSLMKAIQSAFRGGDDYPMDSN